MGWNPTARQDFTTVTNWEVKGYDIEFQGETYTWSKHNEYLKLMDIRSSTKWCPRLGAPAWIRERFI